MSVGLKGDADFSGIDTTLVLHKLGIGRHSGELLLLVAERCSLAWSARGWARLPNTHVMQAKAWEEHRADEVGSAGGGVLLAAVLLHSSSDGRVVRGDRNELGRDDDTLFAVRRLEGIGGAGASDRAGLGVDDSAIVDHPAGTMSVP